MQTFDLSSAANSLGFPVPSASEPPLAIVASGAAEQAVASDSRTGEDALIGNRLGAYSGLFYALRAKHPPTANHCLRVAIGCARWAVSRQMLPRDRDALEIAALFHDIGKIGVPDDVLQKPSVLDNKEQLIMEMNHRLTMEILGGAGAASAVLEILEERFQCEQSYTQCSTAARMLSIVDAYDSMTTKQVFRPALSCERALEELCSHAGTQFDPQLTSEFITTITNPNPVVETELANRWLAKLDSYALHEFGNLEASGAAQTMVDMFFHHKLLQSISDVVAYVDSTGLILHWNRAAERVSGLRAEKVKKQPWSAHLLRLVDGDGKPLTEANCPFRGVAASRTQIVQRLYIQLEGKPKPCCVELTASPVASANNEFAGAIILVRDASTQANLEAKLQTLHVRASLDPLTQVANRAELELRLPNFVSDHLASGQRGSLIICDIDYFKRINDTFGHQAGDQALTTFAAILKECARNDDFIARYGGEEFVILCDDCDNPSASYRAEEIRRAVAARPVASLNNTAMTASFGVTEIQAGDSPSTLLARADRALFTAKESGRNRVAQLGAGTPPKTEDTSAAIGGVKTGGGSTESKSSWLDWFRGSRDVILEREFLAAVPLQISIQKLSGFIADHQAEVLASDEGQVTIKFDGSKHSSIRRSGERPAILLLDIKLSEVKFLARARVATYQNRTKFTVTVRPMRSRDRRASVVQGQGDQILHSFQAYMVAEEINPALREQIIEPR